MSERMSKEAAIDEVIERVIEHRRTGQRLRLSEVIRSNRDLTPELTQRLRLIGSAIRESDRWWMRQDTAAGRKGELRWLRAGIPGYDLQECVDRGGQGIVYRARQRSTNRTVAIKLLPEGPFADEAEPVMCRN